MIRLAIYLRDNFTCIYCRRDLHHAAPEEITLDHLHPRSCGGSNHHTNLVTACFDCNNARGTRHWKGFATPHSRSLIKFQRRLPLPKQLAADLINEQRRARSAERSLKRP